MIVNMNQQQIDEATSNSLLMSTSISTSISTPSSSTSSIDEAKCVQSSSSRVKISEDQSIFYEASLAQAECDDDLGEDSERAKKSYSNFEYVDEDEEDDSVIELSDQSSNLKQLKQIFLQTDTTSSTSTNKLKSDEKLSNEAKEYWATIDFYNNSKLAFNKRLKSVKLKREKLNTELRQRKQGRKETTTTTTHVSKPRPATPTQQIDENLCNCVKCSIIIHEALIQGVQNVHEILCKKCHTKLDVCKCNCVPMRVNVEKSISLEESKSSEAMSVAHSPKAVTIAATSCVRNDFSQFEEKLFNIKNELVNLSETSLDVFQLLLQLSDTVLDLNNQLSSSTNVNQLFLINSHTNLNQNFFTSPYEPNSLSPTTATPITTTTADAAAAATTNHHESQQVQDHQRRSDAKSNKIEDFLQKNFYSTQTEAQSTNKQLNNSITSIINKINNRSNNNNHNKIEQLKKVYTTPKSGPQSPVSPKSSHNKLIENIYDKTSVTQFVDSLLNSKSGDELSRASSGFYSATSLLTMANQNEDDSQMSMCETSQSYSIKQTPNIKLSTTTNHILSRHVNNSSSSNLDLTDVKAYRHSTASTSSSNTDSSIDQTKFLTIQSPKTKASVNGTVAGLAANFSKGSSNTISSSSSCTSPVPNITVNGARKPSFKFENNTILNRVQNMNLKNKFCSITPQTNLNDISETGSYLDKRCSLNRDSLYASERVTVKRQQSVVAAASQKMLQQTPVRSECQTSLDSGINLPSENEESKILMANIQ